MKRLSHTEELEFLKELHGHNMERVFGSLREAFALLQARSQMLVGLATICLTITGFSGPRMAAATPYSRGFIGIGLLFVLLSVVCVVVGPLRLRWMTAWSAGDLDQTLMAYLRGRDLKTRLYKISTVLLLIGLSCYFGGVVCFLAVVD